MRLWKPIILCLVLLLFSTVASSKILFKSRIPAVGIYGIYVMDDDGDNVTVLDDTPPTPFSLAWAPDGKQIVFTRRSGFIFLMNADGTNIRQITDHADDFSPCFSPDGKNIAFKRTERDENGQKGTICVLNLDTGKIRKISDLSAATLDWSPDGKQIVFATALDLDSSGNSIYVMRPDGTGAREIISPPAADAWLNIARWSPTWSPDGKQILYRQTEFTWEERKPNVISLIRKAHRYIICDRNGRTVKQLKIPKNLQPGSLDWMHDGKSIVFSARQAKLNEPPPDWRKTPPANIYTYRIATGKLKKLTHSALPLWDNTYPDWISDQVLPVNPQGKKKVTWGTLKK